MYRVTVSHDRQTEAELVGRQDPRLRDFTDSSAPASARCAPWRCTCSILQLLTYNYYPPWLVFHMTHGSACEVDVELALCHRAI